MKSIRIRRAEATDSVTSHNDSSKVLKGSSSDPHLLTSHGIEMTSLQCPPIAETSQESLQAKLSGSEVRKKLL